MNPKIIAVILAGGSGTRLWPLSRPEKPKQYLRLLGVKTLYRETLERAALFADHAIAVTNKKHLRLAKTDECKNIKVRYIQEPEGRQTTVAAGLAAILAKQSGDPVLVIMPADHKIEGNMRFKSAIKSAAKKAAKEDALVCLGVIPKTPETGYGYICAGKNGGTPSPVQKFIEKPPLGKAETFVKNGNYYWNLGICVARASVLLAAIGKHMPQTARILSEIEKKALKNGRFSQKELAALFSKMPNISLDTGVLEKSSKVWLLPARFKWSDVGSWKAVYENCAKDKNGNVIKGNAVVKDCKNSLIIARNSAAVCDLNNGAFIQTQNGTLLCALDKTQSVKDIAKEYDIKH
ncbi:MAG: sugar phosphate nucleotidyltransferase [Elusimicrobiaceae bacterium]|jgi:mannose-1-phosphate guanylyltransferase/mannose-6-phosphate isomerase